MSLKKLPWETNFGLQPKKLPWEEEGEYLPPRPQTKQIPVEQIYEAAKSGKIDPGRLSPEYKKELKDYITTKDTVQPQKDWETIRRSAGLGPSLLNIPKKEDPTKLKSPLFKELSLTPKEDIKKRGIEAGSGTHKVNVNYGNGKKETFTVKSNKGVAQMPNTNVALRNYYENQGFQVDFDNLTGDIYVTKKPDLNNMALSPLKSPLDNIKREPIEKKYNLEPPKILPPQANKPNLEPPPLKSNKDISELDLSQYWGQTEGKVRTAPDGSMRKIDAFTGGIAAGIIPGTGDKLRKQNPDKSGWITAGEALGTLVPFGAAYKGANLLAKPILNKLAPKALQIGLKTGVLQAPKITETALKGALAGAPVGAIKGTVEGGDLQSISKEALEYAVMGALGDAAFEGVIIPALKPIFKRFQGRIMSAEAVEKELVNDLGIDINKLGDEQRAKLRNVIERELPSFNSQPQIKNTGFETASKQYDEAIGDIQNHFMTNELRTDEVKRIKPELGIDLDRLVRNMEVAENNPPTLNKLTERNRLAKTAGIFPEPKQLVKPLDLTPPKINTPKEKPMPNNLTPPDIGVRPKVDLTPPNIRVAPKSQSIDLTPPSINTVSQKIDLTPPAIKPINERVPVPEIGTPKLRSFPGTVETSNLTSPELKNIIKQKPQTYQPTTNKETLKVAQEIVDSNFGAAKALVMEGKSFENATEGAIAQDIVRRLQNEKRWDEAFEVMAKASEKFTRAGQTVQSAALWRRMTPEGILKYAHKTFEKANEQLPIGKKVSVTKELQEELYNSMKQIELMEDGIEKDQAIALVQDKIMEKVPITLGRKLSTIQAMSHLLNGRTTLRNILGNTSFSVAELISNLWAIPFDKYLARQTGKKTVTTPTLLDPLKAGWQRGKQSVKEVSLGIDTLSSQGKYDLFEGQTFRKGPLNKLEKGLSYTLRVPDEFFKGYRQEQALQQMVKMAGVKQATPEMTEQAVHEARYATFQDNSLPSQILQSVKEVSNKIGIGKTVRGSQLKSTKEFGFGDFLIKYTKVPGNIISRSVEYTPAGALKALSLMKEAKVTGKLNQREMALTLGRAMTGTSMIGLGAWLHNKGLILSQDKDMDKDARALETAEGLGNYKVNITAIDRILSGGDPKPKAGDELYSYNWCSPVSVAFAIGSAIDSQMKKDGTPIKTAEAIGAKSMDEILDLPTMFVIQKMFYEGMSSDSNIFTIATVPVAEGAPGFVPSVVRQLAQWNDPIARQTKGKDTFETMKLKTKANIPEMRKELLPRLDPFGKEITYPNGLVTNMLSPGNKSVYNPSPLTPKLKKLEELTGETKHYPMSTPMKTFSQNKIGYKLTPEEQNVFQQIAGKQVEEQYVRILENIDIERLNDQQRTELINHLSKINSEARQAAKLQILKTRVQKERGY